MRLAPLTADESRALLEQLTVALTRFEFHGLADRVETILSDYQPPKNNAVETLGNLVRTNNAVETLGNLVRTVILQSERVRESAARRVVRDRKEKLCPDR